MNEVYCIWKAGYSTSASLSVEMVAETEKAYKFRVLDSTKEYTFFMPKSAVKFDKNVQGIINVPRWFKVEGFLAYLFDRFASHYRR